MLQSVFKFTTFGDESHIACIFKEVVISNRHGCNLQQSVSEKSITVQNDPVAGLVLCSVGTGGSFPRIRVDVAFPQHLATTY